VSHGGQDIRIHVGWHVCADFKMVTLARGVGGASSKLPCFMCCWDQSNPTTLAKLGLSSKVRIRKSLFSRQGGQRTCLHHYRNIPGGNCKLDQCHEISEGVVWHKVEGASLSEARPGSDLLRQWQQRKT
jgi:hypothetical protein